MKCNYNKLRRNTFTFNKNEKNISGAIAKVHSFCFVAKVSEVKI